MDALCCVRFEVLTAVSLKIWVFWDFMLCHWIIGTCCLSGTWSLHMWSQAVEEEDRHSFTSQKIRIFYIMLIGLWLVVFVYTVTCHIYVTLKDRKCSLSGINDHNALWHYRRSYNVKLRVVAVLKKPQRVVAWEKQS